MRARELGVTLCRRRRWSGSRGRCAPRRRGVAPSPTIAPRSAPDAVDIVTSAESHRRRGASRAGRHYFVEKPPARTSRRRGCRSRAESTGRVVQVGHVFRFHPVTATLRERSAPGASAPALRHRSLRFKRLRLTWGHRDANPRLISRLPLRSAGDLSQRCTGLPGPRSDDLSVTVVHYGDVPAVVEASYFCPDLAQDRRRGGTPWPIRSPSVTPTWASTDSAGTRMPRRGSLTGVTSPSRAAGLRRARRAANPVPAAAAWGLRSSSRPRGPVWLGPTSRFRSRLDSRVVHAAQSRRTIQTQPRAPAPAASRRQRWRSTRGHDHGRSRQGTQLAEGYKACRAGPVGAGLGEQFEIF